MSSPRVTIVAPRDAALRALLREGLAGAPVRIVDPPAPLDVDAVTKALEGAGPEHTGSILCRCRECMKRQARILGRKDPATKCRPVRVPPAAAVTNAAAPADDAPKDVPKPLKVETGTRVLEYSGGFLTYVAEKHQNGAITLRRELPKEHGKAARRRDKRERRRRRELEAQQARQLAPLVEQAIGLGDVAAELLGHGDRVDWNEVDAAVKAAR